MTVQTFLNDVSFELTGTDRLIKGTEKGFFKSYVYREDGINVIINEFIGEELPKGFDEVRVIEGKELAVITIAEGKRIFHIREADFECSIREDYADWAVESRKLADFGDLKYEISINGHIIVDKDKK